MMIMKKNKSSFYNSSESESECKSDVEYEEGDCFDLDDEWKPIPKVVKKELFDKTRIANYILFSTIITLFGYILYTTIRELYK